LQRWCADYLYRDDHGPSIFAGQRLWLWRVDLHASLPLHDNTGVSNMSELYVRADTHYFLSDGF